MDFNVEAKYSIEIFEKNDIDCTWDTIQVGYDLERLTLHEIEKFAIFYLESHPKIINEYISELICGIQEYEINNCLKNAFLSLGLKFPEKYSAIWNREWLKWRYCILSEMVKNIKNDEELIYKVEGLCADFGYPDDMKNLIYYMPADKVVMPLTPVEARKKLIEKAKNFLAYEREKIDQGACILPSRGINY